MQTRFSNAAPWRCQAEKRSLVAATTAATARLRQDGEGSSDGSLCLCSRVGRLVLSPPWTEVTEPATPCKRWGGHAVQAAPTEEFGMCVFKSQPNRRHVNKDENENCHARKP